MVSTRALSTACLLALTVLAGSACSDASPGISVSIAGQFRRSNGGLVDLAEANPAAWERVCVLGPHSGNAAVKSLLGFDWDAEGRTAIRDNDGIALLLFVQGKQVSAFAENPRNLGDFAPLSGKCFARAHARFQQAHESNGRPAGLYPRAD
jgi:hypothetical protein